MSHPPQSSMTRAAGALALSAVLLTGCGSLLRQARPILGTPIAAPTISAGAPDATAVPAPVATVSDPVATAAKPAAPDAAVGAAPANAAAAPEAAQASIPSSININAAGIATNVRAETREAIVTQKETPAFASGLPVHVRIAFGDDKLTNDFVNYHERQILVIPVTEYIAQFKDTPDIQKDMTVQINALKTLLKRRPSKVSEPITVVPPANAAQVFRARVKYLNFKGGSGVRFITHYAQDVSPVTSSDLIYAFQGLTADGKYYVSAFIPVGTAALTESFENLTAVEKDEATNHFDAYLKRITKTIEAQKPADFKPGLNEVDAMLQSLDIKSPALSAPVPVAPDAQATAAPAAGAVTARTTAVLNVRAEASVSSRLLGRLRRGVAVTPIGRDASSVWVRVRYGKASEGWVQARYLRGVTVAALAALAEIK